MPAVSKAQQRFMGMVHVAQKGDMENPSPEVSKAADSMSDKDAKDFASTSHKGLPDHVREMVLSELRGIKSIQTDYMKTVDAIAQTLELYKKSKGTPNEKKAVERLKQLQTLKKKLANELDAKVSGMYKDVELKADLDEMTGTDSVEGYGTPYAFTAKGGEKSKAKKQADLTGYSVVKENRWINLKKEDSTPIAKVNRGISNVNKQLAEIEKFLGWYGRLKQENGVTNEHFWKRTNSNIYKIKERLIKLEQHIRKISE
jgi:hypothetical protein